MCNIHVMIIPEGEEREKETEEIFEAILTQNFPQINVRHESKGPVSSENTKKDKCKNTTKQNKNYTKDIMLKLQIFKDKEKILKEARVEKHLIYRGANISITSDLSEIMQRKTEWD